jgi:glutathione S-transferase
MLEHYERFGVALLAEVDVASAVATERTMAKPLLIIGNKNYSSWSLRAYMALAQPGIPFEEQLIHFGDPKFKEKVGRYSKAGLVPVLKHNDIVVWESLAILEYIAEAWPKKQLWPKNKSARAFARSMCSEMLANFRALRNECPMNIRRAPKPLIFSDGVKEDISRIDELWSTARKAYGKGGPFLFGKFSLADAMFAPVASRIATYEIPVSKLAQNHVDALLSTHAFETWKQAALNEPWIVPEDEVD